MDLLELIKANKQLKIAEYLLIETYPLSKDPKLLIGVLLNIKEYYNQLLNSLTKINFLTPKTEELKLKLFQEQNKLKLSQEELQSIEMIYHLVNEHEKSPVEFVRKQRLILCNDKYELQTLSKDVLKNYLFVAKQIHQKIILFVRSNKND